MQHSELLDIILSICLTVSFTRNYNLLHRWCNAKKLKSVNISGKFLIPKISLVDSFVSQHSFDITRKTWKRLILIKGFLEML